MRNITAFILMLFFITGCKKDTIDVYGETNYIYFANESAQVLEYSFAFHPGVTRDTIPLILELIGKLSDADRPIHLQVDAANTTASGNDFELPENPVFHAGKARDTVALILHNSERLLMEKLTLRVVIHPNTHFSPGPESNRFKDILFSDIITRPAWWSQIVTTNFLGEYSDAKYRYFIEATGISDMSELSENEQRAYAIIFRDFLARGRANGQEYEDENGKINVSPNLT